MEEISRKTLVLTEEGKKYAVQGSPEVQLFLAVPEQGSISMRELQEKLGGSFNYAVGYAKNWVDMNRTQVSRKVQHVDDVVQALLLKIQEGKETDEDGINFLKSRNLIEEVSWNGYSSIKRGPCYAPQRKKVATDLTRENLLNWKELDFTEYNFNAKGAPVDVGHLHPLLKVRKQFTDIFAEMGFEEMPTNNFLESSFWNFDALFQPQQHPARDAHDT